MKQFIRNVFALILAMLLTATLGCGEKKTIFNSQVVSDREGGTDNTGGGNGVGGKPFESYIEKDIESKPYFSDGVKPLIQKIAEVEPKLAADFYHITLERLWYFVPTELENISSNILGSYGKHEQYALQDTNKVWINSIFFDKMSQSEQSTLMIHEIVMGIRLLRYTNKQDQCIAKAARLLIGDSNRSAYREQRRKCRRAFPITVGEAPRFKLDRGDYDLIRKLVSLLDRNQPDVEEVLSLMESTGFRKYED